MTLLPTVREQLEQAAQRTSRPERAVGALRTAALVVAVVVVVAAAAVAVLGGTSPVPGRATGHADGSAIVAPAGSRLAPAVYRRMVVFAYTIDPALLEDTETVLPPVGHFQLRLPTVTAQRRMG